MSIYTKPSFYAHVLNGFLMLLAIIILFNNYKRITALSSYQQLVLVLLFSISMGVHSISHLGLEHDYNFNPLELKME